MNKVEIAQKKFEGGYNCCQSVLFAFFKECGISSNFAIKLGTAFGAGMGRTQEVCGAVSGAYMVLSMLYGRNEDEDKSKQEFVYSKVQQYTKLFIEKNNFVRCFELLDKCNLQTDGGQKRFRDENLHLKCRKYIEDSVDILIELTKE